MIHSPNAKGVTNIMDRNSVTLRLSVLVLASLATAQGVPLTYYSLVVQLPGGNTVNSSMSTSWGGTYPSLVATQGGAIWNYGDISSLNGIFLLPSTSSVFGLTNSQFQCDISNTNGCGSFQVSFTLLGVSTANLPVNGTFTIGLNGSSNLGVPFQGVFTLSVVSPGVAFQMNNPVGALALGVGTGSFSSSNASTPLTFLCLGCPTSNVLALMNITVLLGVVPLNSGDRFAAGSSLTLPSSFTLTVDAVPEPGAGCLAALGLAVLAVLRRQRAA